MEDNQQQQENYAQPTPKKDRTPLFIGIVVVLLAAVIFLYYTYDNLKADKEAQAIELNNTLLNLDSISTELDSKIMMIRELGGEVDTLMKVKEKLTRG